MRKLLPFVLLLAGCQQEPDPAVLASTEPKGFEKTPAIIPIKNGAIPEASGMADSKKNAGYLWVQQDRGNPTYLYLLKHDGTITDSVFLEGVTNQDWEDMALSGDQLYIGDLGDNNQVYPQYRFYCFDEPTLGTQKITSFKTIDFKYPDGSHDAEAFLVEPSTKDIYVITKQGDRSKVYKLAYPQSNTSLNEAVFVADLTFNGAVSACLSPDAKEIIVKTYSNLYYYTKAASEPILMALAKPPSQLDYQVEMQGEAVTFGVDNKGFYTLSERIFNSTPALNYYGRK